MSKLGVAIILICILIFALNCADNSSITQVEEQNKAVVYRLHNEISNGNLDIFDELLAPNYIRHCQAMSSEFQDLRGIDTYKFFMQDFLKGIPDCKDSVHFVMAEGDLVSYVMSTTGTQTGPLGTLPASNKEFELISIVIHRFENGKIAESWVSWDNVAMLTQLGLFPTSVPPPANP
jgi:predicted ester cyclase